MVKWKEVFLLFNFYINCAGKKSGFQRGLRERDRRPGLDGARLSVGVVVKLSPRRP